jgi:REP element-mobilizing transposase RayT
MSRPLRIQFPGGVHHVTSRGDRRETIFVDDRDRALMLDVLAQGLARFDATVLAYCLMGNHYHLVVQTRQGNLSRLMRHVNGVYAQAFNRRHDQVGHVFQGRFNAIHVDRDAYLLEVCRYTELNPVRAQFVDNPQDWRWSSYNAHCCLAQAPPWLDTAGLHGHLLGRDVSSIADRRIAASRYAQFVAAGRDVRLWDRALRQDIYLGDDAFVSNVLQRAGVVARSSTDIPAAQRRVPKSALKPARGSADRDDAINIAYRQDGMTMTAIAAAVGLSVSRISRIVRKRERR